MQMKMAVQIVVRAPYDSSHQISAVALSLHVSRWPCRLLVTRLHLFENGTTGALHPTGASIMPPPTAV